MKSSRLEAFSDGVLAIIITIMVLELKIPHGESFDDLADSATGLLTYLLSFVYIGIYWNNHHHMFHVVEQVRGGVLWANLHLLFWLSLVPFSNAWMDEEDFAQDPTATYGLNLLGAAIAYFILEKAILRAEGPGSRLREALGRDLKGKISPLIYVPGIVLAFVEPALSLAAYAVVAMIWLVPDRRIERLVDA